MAQHTKDFLAQELRAAGLNKMADKAATGWYHDFISPLALPETQLLIDLQEQLELRMAAQVQDLNVDVAAVQKLIDRHMEGEFDASREESDAWAASEDGQAAFQELVQSIRK
jgi:hypothetical protein